LTPTQVTNNKLAIPSGLITTGSDIMKSLMSVYKSAICRAYLGTNQSITNNLATKINIDTVDFDLGGCFDPTNKKYIAPYDGFYSVSMGLTVDVNLASGKSSVVRIYVNGVQHSTHEASTTGSPTNYQVLTVSDIARMRRGDYIQMYGGHNDATSRNVIGGSNKTWLAISLISYD